MAGPHPTIEMLSPMSGPAWGHCSIPVPPCTPLAVPAWDWSLAHLWDTQAAHHSHCRATGAGPCPLPGPPSGWVLLALQWGVQPLADGDLGMGPQLPEGPMRMEHDPTGPACMRLSPHGRTAQHIHHERAPPAQSMPGRRRRCSRIPEMLQGHFCPRGPQLPAGRMSLGTKAQPGAGGGGCSTSPLTGVL